MVTSARLARWFEVAVLAAVGHVEVVAHLEGVRVRGRVRVRVSFRVRFGFRVRVRVRLGLGLGLGLW